MLKNKKSPRTMADVQRGKQDEIGKHPVPIVSHAAHGRKRLRIRLRLRPIHGLILLGGMLCAYPLMMAGVNAIGAGLSVGILAGLLIFVGVMA